MRVELGQKRAKNRVARGEPTAYLEASESMESLWVLTSVRSAGRRKEVLVAFLLLGQNTQDLQLKAARFISTVSPWSAGPNAETRWQRHMAEEKLLRP